MATIPRPSIRRRPHSEAPVSPAAVPPVPPAPEPQEAIPQEADPQAPLGLDRICLLVWLGGAAILLLLHGWHHFVTFMGWWN